MVTDTGDFRSSERLLLVKHLSQATCCTAHIMQNAVAPYNTNNGAKKDEFTGKCAFGDI